MRIGLALLALPLLASAASAGAQPATSGGTTANGIERPERARENYILKCQGCHGADAGGFKSLTPAMAGAVSRFLWVPGGREYLARVPGVATAAVDDAELAELLNWTLYHFDAAHIPPDFTPYKASEIARLRKSPLRTEAAATRRSLIEQINNIKTAAK